MLNSSLCVSKCVLLVVLIAACSPFKIQKEEKKNHLLSSIEENLRTDVYVENDPMQYEISERMKYHAATGFSLTTIKDFKIEASKGFGYCRKEDLVEVQNNSVFRVGSISKPLTAIVVLKLHEQRVLDIDHDIQTYLKTWQLPVNPFSKDSPITLRKLLQHRAGLKEQQMTKLEDEGHVEGDRIFSLNEILDGQSPLQPFTINAQPGSVYKYSNQGYNLIQKVLEDVTGKKFEDLAEDIVLKPFEMSNSTFRTVYPNQNLVNFCYAYKDENVHKRLYQNTVKKCSGGLFSTSRDLAKFCIKTANIINGKDEFLNEKHAKQILEGENYGLGFDLIKKDSLFLFSHSGRTSGFYSFMAMNPENGEGFVMLVNSDGVGDFFSEMLRSASHTFNWNLWNPSKNINKIDINTDNYHDYLGRYKFSEDGEEYIIDIVIKQNELYYIEYEENRQYEFLLIPISKNIFIDAIDGTKIEFNLKKEKNIAFVYDNEYTFEKLN